MMLKYLTIVVLGIMLIGLTGCKFSTPEIRGIVLDTETKEPVEGAWVTATLEVYSKTVAGDAHQSLFVGKTWTDKKGRFVIPSKEFKKPPFPVSFGSKVESLDISARAVSSKGYIKGGIGIEELKKEEEVTLYIKPPENPEVYYLSLQTLYNYILTGRLGVSVPVVPKTESTEALDIAIGGYEKFLERYNEKYLEEYKKYEEERGGYITASYRAALDQLADLYERKGDFKKAIDILQEVKKRTLFRPQDIDAKIQRIQQKLKERQK